jgi:heat-inducible transcriptional repressor
MRTVKPEIVKEREEKILRMIVREFVETHKPIGSELVAQKGLPGVSSATIRNIMKKLEDEGYLYQPHSSGGRIPTDKAYRFFVDYLSKIQTIAAKERQRIEDEYKKSNEEINRVMVQTCRMLSGLSHLAGFVFTSNVSDRVVQRLDFMPLGVSSLLAILVTADGAVKHWPVRVEIKANPSRLLALNGFINERISGLSVRDARRVLWEYVSKPDGGEFAAMAEIALQILKEMSLEQAQGDRLYIEGMSRLLETMPEEESGEAAKMLKVIEERDKFAGLLVEKMRLLQCDKSNVNVSIGCENKLSELRNMSIVTTAYKVGDKTVGILGIVGPKHMQYNRMISLVNFIGEMLGNAIEHWQISLENKNDEEE